MPGGAGGPEVVDGIVRFLAVIGIDVREGEVPATSFLPGVRIADGGLVFDRGTLRWPGDLLHEAAHIAITPPALRSSLNDGAVIPASVPHATEAEATAWAFAALRHLGLDPEVLFHPGGYGGHSPSLVATFGAGVYPGAFGLAQAGMTSVGAGPADGATPAYPRMARWLRP